VALPTACTASPHSRLAQRRTIREGPVCASQLCTAFPITRPGVSFVGHTLTPPCFRVQHAPHRTQMKHGVQSEGSKACLFIGVLLPRWRAGACPTLEHTKDARLDVLKGSARRRHHGCSPGPVLRSPPSAASPSAECSVRRAGAPQREALEWGQCRSRARRRRATAEALGFSNLVGWSRRGPGIWSGAVGAPGAFPRLRVLVNCAGVFCTEHQRARIGQAERCAPGRTFLAEARGRIWGACLQLNHVATALVQN